MEHRFTSNAIATHTRPVSRKIRETAFTAHHRTRPYPRALCLRRPPVRKKRRNTTGRGSDAWSELRNPTGYRDIRKFATEGRKEKIATSRHRTRRRPKKSVGRRVSTTRTIFRQWCTADWLPDKSCSRIQVGEGS